MEADVKEVQENLEKKEENEQSLEDLMAQMKGL